MPDINWSSLCGNSLYSTSLCDFVFDYNLSQVIQIPTHTGGNILDIVLTERIIHNNVIDYVCQHNLPSSLVFSLLVLLLSSF